MKKLESAGEINETSLKEAIDSTVFEGSKTRKLVEDTSLTYYDEFMLDEDPLDDKMNEISAAYGNGKQKRIEFQENGKTMAIYVSKNDESNILTIEKY